jgi:hypothetical protein
MQLADATEKLRRSGGFGATGWAAERPAGTARVDGGPPAFMTMTAPVCDHLKSDSENMHCSEG